LFVGSFVRSFVRWLVGRFVCLFVCLFIIYRSVILFTTQYIFPQPSFLPLSQKAHRQ